MKLFQKRQPQQAAKDPLLEELEAEYRNYRRRTALELEQANDAATRRAVLNFLPLYDDLERALRQPCQDEAYRRGIEMVMRNLLAILASMKVQPMDSLHRCFNPAYHEAVEHITDPQYREDEIVAVVRTGFTMDEEIIRHARVVVAN